MEARFNEKSSDHAYSTICQKITSGEFAPGTKLTRRDLAKLIGVSVTSIIEALRRLESEGLVESFPHYGSRVTPLDRRTIRDRFALREAVECQVARILAKRITREQGQHLLSLARNLDDIPRCEEKHTEFWNAHFEFHIAMAECTDCPSLVRTLKSINLFTLLRMVTNRDLWRTDRIPPDIHVNIVNAIIMGKPDQAERAMRRHMYASKSIDPN